MAIYWAPQSNGSHYCTCQSLVKLLMEHS